MSTPKREEKGCPDSQRISPPPPLPSPLAAKRVRARREEEGGGNGGEWTYLGKIWGVEPFGKKSRLGVWHATKTAGVMTDNDTLLATDNANLETRVLRSFEHFVPVQAVEGLGSVPACDGVVD
jgi:hypothetical protein